MRSASSALISLLGSSTQFLMADLVTVTQVSGAVTRLTSWGTALTVGGNTFTPGPPYFTRTTWKVAVGVTVDTMGLTILCGVGAGAALLGGVPWPEAVRTGALDGARVQLERIFMPSPGDTSAGTVILFAGRVAEASPERDAVALTVKSDLELLNTLFPRNVFQPGCAYTLFDSGCALAKASWAVSLSALAGSSATSLTATDSHASGYFDLGTITFTTGALAGQSFTVKAQTLSGSTATFTFAAPLPAAPAAGDAFTAYPGCDKRLATCQSKFNNAQHFRGYPLIPAAETAV